MTDITGNDGSWTFMCASWKSVGGKWKIYKNGKLADEGINLAKGKTVKGSRSTFKLFCYYYKFSKIDKFFRF